jgi:hypothetical protein
MQVAHRLALAALLAVPVGALAQPYNYTVNQPASSLTYTISFSAPFQTSPAGSSYLIGTRAGADAVPGNADDPATGSRTITGIFGADPGTNLLINLSSGSISASGNNGSTAYHPSGAFTVDFNVAGATCSVSNLAANLLGGGSASLAATASVGYPSFRTREPNCTLPSLGPLSLPIGDIAASSITATQTGASTGGTMSPVVGQPGRHNFAASVPAVINVTATLNGAEAPIDPQPVTLTVSGTVDFNLPGAPVSVTVSVNQTQVVPGPFALDPLAFNEPLCNAPLLIKLTLASTSTTINTTATLSASGAPAGCGPADIGVAGGLNGSDGELDNNDFIAFINYFFASNPLADRGVAGGLPGTDGLYDNNDFIVFINQFFAGC